MLYSLSVADSLTFYRHERQSVKRNNMHVKFAENNPLASFFIESPSKFYIK